MIKFILGGITTLFVLISIAFTIVASGSVNIGADHEHSPLLYRLLETARVKSIQHASQNFVVPKLDKPAMISAGGADYQDMCADCHLSPNVANTDLSAGLYPKPPNFTDPNVVSRFADEAGAKQGFWAIKHGIMASGMPAWGATHEDDRIWAMLAFIKTLPNLTANQYTMLTTRFDPDVMDVMDVMMDKSMKDSMDSSMNHDMGDMMADSMGGMSGEMQH